MQLLDRDELLLFAAVTDIALNGRVRPVSSKAVADRAHLPARYLEALLQALVREGVLKSTSGPAGGYQLAREATDITAKDILDAIGRIKAAQYSGPSELHDVVVLPPLADAEK